MAELLPGLADTKLTRAALRLLVRAPADDGTKYARACAHILLQEVMPRLDHEETEIEDSEEYHFGLKDLIVDLSLLYSEDFIEWRHVKKTIKDCWSYPYVGYDFIQYAVATGLLDESDGDELLTVVREVMAENPKAVEQLRAGKDKAIGALVGLVLKKTKADPKQVNSLIRSEL